MVRNCTDDLNYVPIGVPPTFKLGYFYVTPMVSPLKMLVAKGSGKSPIYLGPLLVHQSLKFSNYDYFASQVVNTVIRTYSDNSNIYVDTLCVHTLQGIAFKFTRSLWNVLAE